MKRILKMSNAGVKVGRMKRKEELSVICIEVVVQGKEDIRVLRGVVYMTKSKGPRTALSA